MRLNTGGAMTLAEWVGFPLRVFAVLLYWLTLGLILILVELICTPRKMKKELGETIVSSINFLFHGMGIPD